MAEGTIPRVVRKGVGARHSAAGAREPEGDGRPCSTGVEPAPRRTLNLEILRRTQPDLADRLERIGQGSERWTTVPGPQGTVFEQVAGGESFVVSEPPPQGIGDLLACGPRVLLFGGMMTGRALAAAVRLHGNAPGQVPGMLVPYYVIEPSTGLFAAHLEASDFEEFCALGNVIFFVGDDCREQFERYLTRQPCAPLPGHLVHTSPDLSRWADTLGNRRLARASSHFRVIDDHYRTLEPGRIVERLARRGTEAPRVMFLTTIFSTFVQHCARDMASGCEALGSRTRVLKENSPTGRLTAAAVTQAIAHFKPDLIVGINSYRTKLNRAGRLIPPQVPFATWLQDWEPDLLEPVQVASTSSRDFLYSALPEWIPLLEQAGHREVRLLPLAVDPGRFGRDEPEEAAWECDVSFVSHFYPPEPEEECPQLVTHLLAILEREGIGFEDIDFYRALLGRAERELGVEVVTSRQELVSRIYQRLPRIVWRLAPLRWARAAGADLRLYGKGWETLADLAGCGRGELPNGPPLHRVYRSSRVNLHLNEALNLHQRVFECLAAGGFMMARSIPSDRLPGGLEETLVPGEHLVTFDSEADFARKLRRYLDDDVERRRIASAGRERVLMAHTYEHRMRVVLDDVAARLGAGG